jgi:hypothetical protein
MLVVVGLFWFLAVFVFVVSQWIVPAFYGGTPSPTTGFDYRRSFGLPFIKTWGLWVAGGLLVLGPFAAVWKALERGGEALLGKALGAGGSRRGSRVQRSKRR